jgi:hypothetical protein
MFKRIVNRQTVLTLVLSLCMVLLVAGLAFADANTDPGVQISAWLIKNLGGLFTVGLIIGAIYFLIKREVMGFVGFLILAMAVAFLIFAPDAFKCWSISVFNHILGTTASCT